MLQNKQNIGSEKRLFYSVVPKLGSMQEKKKKNYAV
jgi:hypothetical protein